MAFALRAVNSNISDKISSPRKNCAQSQFKFIDNFNNVQYEREHCNARTRRRSMVGYVSGASLVFALCLQQALVLKGHEVTIISAGSQHVADFDGVHHIRVNALNHLIEDFRESCMDLKFPMQKWEEASFVANFFYNSSFHVLNDPGVQSLLQDKSAQFDMVIVETTFTDALYGFAQHFNAPLVGLSICGASWNINYLAGNKAISVYEPIVSSGYSTGFSVLNKIKNWIYITEEWLLEQMIYLPKQLALYKRFFNESAESLHNIRQNFALILINQHFSLGRARSNVPNVIEVAGMHLEQPITELDQELQQFMDEAEHGVIVFSMGTAITGKWFPDKLIEMMLQSFDQLPQRIVLKFDQPLPIKSHKIYLRSTLPQRALLAHPKVKLFITHGGILSIIEAAYSSVPMLCMPLYYDQLGNSKLMEQSGLAQILDFSTMTVESITNSIKEIIENPLYKQNAQQISTRLRDLPMSPLENAVWWTEYVLRHKGAPHMRISMEDMSLIQYYNLDFISVLILRSGVALLIIFCVSLKLVIFLLQRSQFRLTVPILY
ncbi:UDP-glucuronosyltransferase 2B33 isoform X2 [Drosophila hydei]|uniref:UDP-glucuronosyltransferase 2B33 isoform X2 n=1 Tax=Drosophila hydei TaxID=7224 RepID=A0A6J1M1L1_DROHY|nr:UDP-glucuronosyltransferase 2B33 isoform X2 [Drosophila hydei]